MNTANKAIKFVPAAKSAASTGLPTLRFGSRLWRRYISGGMMNIKLSSSLFISIFLFGCATTPTIENISQGKAVIVMYNDSIAKVLSPLGATKSSRVESIDGKKVSDFWNSVKKIEIAKGKHEVEVSCRIIRGGLDVSGLEKKTINFQAATVYRFTPQFGQSNSCVLALTQNAI